MSVCCTFPAPSDVLASIFLSIHFFDLSRKVLGPSDGLVSDDCESAPRSKSQNVWMVIRYILFLILVIAALGFCAARKRRSFGY